MGYVPPPPPSGLFVLPKGMTYQAFDDLPYLYAAGMKAWARPQMVIVHRQPATYAEYRDALYGDPGRDWFPFLNAGLLVSCIAFVVALAWALVG